MLNDVGGIGFYVQSQLIDEVVVEQNVEFVDGNVLLLAREILAHAAGEGFLHFLYFWGRYLRQVVDEFVETVILDLLVPVLEGVDDGAHPILQGAFGTHRKTAHELSEVEARLLLAVVVVEDLGHKMGGDFEDRLLLVAGVLQSLVIKGDELHEVLLHHDFTLLGVLEETFLQNLYFLLSESRAFMQPLNVVFAVLTPLLRQIVVVLFYQPLLNRCIDFDVVVRLFPEFQVDAFEDDLYIFE